MHLWLFGNINAIPAGQATLHQLISPLRPVIGRLCSFACPFFSEPVPIGCIASSSNGSPKASQFWDLSSWVVEHECNPQPRMKTPHQLVHSCLSYSFQPRSPRKNMLFGAFPSFLPSVNYTCGNSFTAIPSALSSLALTFPMATEPLDSEKALRPSFSATYTFLFELGHYQDP